MKFTSMMRVLVAGLVAGVLAGCQSKGSEPNKGRATGAGEPHTVYGAATELVRVKGQAGGGPGIPEEGRDYKVLLGAHPAEDGFGGALTVDRADPDAPWSKDVGQSFELRSGFAYIFRWSRWPIGRTRRTAGGLEVPAAPPGNGERRVVWFAQHDVDRVFFIGSDATGDFITLVGAPDVVYQSGTSSGVQDVAAPQWPLKPGQFIEFWHAGDGGAAAPRNGVVVRERVLVVGPRPILPTGTPGEVPADKQALEFLRHIKKAAEDNGLRFDLPLPSPTTNRGAAAESAGAEARAPIAAPVAAQTQAVVVTPPPPPYAPGQVAAGTPIKTTVGKDLPLTIDFDWPSVSGMKHTYRALIGAYNVGEAVNGEATVDAHEVAGTSTSPAQSASMSMYRGFMYIVRPTRFPLGRTRRTPGGLEIYTPTVALADPAAKPAGASATTDFEGHLLWYNDGRTIRVFSIGSNSNNVYTLHFQEADPRQQVVDLKQGFYVEAIWDPQTQKMIISQQRGNDDPGNPQDVKDFLAYVEGSAVRFGLAW